MPLDQVDIAAVRQKNPPLGMTVKFVAIDGHGGAGKSTLAKQLAKLLQAEVIHTDDFASYDNPLDWWPRLIEEVLEPVKQGVRSLSYDRGSWYKNHSPAPITNQPVTPIMLVEGVSSSRKEFRLYLSYAIWVETPLEVCKERGIARDMADKAAKKTYQELENDWRRWHKYELEYVKQHSPREYADVVISGTSS